MDPMNDPQIKNWAEAAGAGLDYLDFLSQRVGLSEWIALSRVFLPEFVEVEGCVLWDRAYEPGNFRTWHDQLGGDATSIEAVLNQFRLWQHIDIGEDPESEANALALAQEIATVWRLSLQRTFPQRIFDVQANDTVDGPVVSFTSLA
ncbi:hypothetical protein OG883_42390 [Streptomyces sp. NBC_01142]|uniref:hypothetical protein n=1 Tax=Streptomyces sp. NBC_01142 TaxID=2975865 RepID=UPI002258A24A|nr:hypothetical protein [Streptomyces sp. NBC_01142]MCX4826297.1 hypothetical protein [Streptomyces sp. NBC_01142]